MISFAAQKAVGFTARNPYTLRQDREHSVAILGSCKENPENQDQRILAEKVAEKLAKRDYDVFTGGGSGIMRSANKGAFNVNPLCSWAILVKQFLEKEISNMGIYRGKEDVKNTGPERTADFMRECNHGIVFPGGPGTGEELWSLLEAKTYKDGDSIRMDNLVLVNDNGYYDPQLKTLDNMEKFKFAKSPDSGKRLRDMVKVINIDHNNLDKTATEIANHIFLKSNQKSDEKIPCHAFGHLTAANHDSD